MPTPVSAARQCLAQDAAVALDDAVSNAARRGHAQTTSLHVFSALLSLPSSSPSPLRDALSRSRSSSYSPRVQLRALDLCFSSALDRLPSPSNPNPEEPPVSNSLMAAIKRSQANQRRNPETFHLYQQQQQQTPSSPTTTTTTTIFAGVKVELQQLILAMLDDPVISRVFADAGFRSNDVKLALLRPPPSSVLRLPRATRLPPLFLCNFSTAHDDLEPVPRIGSGFPFATELLFPDGSEENCRRIGEMMVKGTGKGRNPLLVGAGAAAALRDFERVLGSGKGGELPKEIAGLRFFSVEEEVRGRGREAAGRKLEEVRRVVEREGEEGGLGGGVLLNFGDLTGFVEECGGGEEGEWLGGVVEEVTRMLSVAKGRLWLMGSSATYETYMKFLATYPSVDKDWDLQLLPITSVAFGSPGSSQRHGSLTESFVPLGGFYPFASSSSLPSSSLHQQPASRCWQCNEKYEQEIATLLKDSSLSLSGFHKADLPSWLHNAEQMSLSNLDITKAKGDQTDMKNKVVDLQKKWDDTCQKLHRSLSTFRTVSCHAGPEAFPWVAGFPSLADKGSPSQLSSSTDITQCQSTIQNTFSIVVEKTLSPKQSFSASVPSAGNVSTGLQIVDLNTMLSKTIASSPPLFLQSGLDVHDSHPSPSSLASVSTDLTLGTVHASPYKEGKSAPGVNLPVSDDISRWLSIQKSNVVNENASTVTAQSLLRHSYLDKAAQKSSFPQVPDASLFISRNQGLCSNECDSRDSKELYKGMVEKVGRQEEAIYVISETITRCRAGNGKHQGIWLSFLGPDKNAKKKVATALSELLFGSKEKLLRANLDSNDGNMSSNMICDEEGISGCDNFRGKMVVDHIAGEIRSKPFSVVLLENVDKADFLVQSSLSQAVRTGRFCDSHGRDIGIRNTVFITTARDGKDGAVSPEKRHCHFSEEKVLAAQKWQMEILPKPLNKGGNQNASSPVYSNKRKLDSADEGHVSCELREMDKRPKKEPNPVLDLNLPLDDAVTADAESSSTEHNSTSSESPDAWLEEFFGLIDGTIKFKPFDFDALANSILNEISKCLKSSISADCLLEIDPKAMEQMLAATWLLDGMGALRSWLQQVLTKTFVEANDRYDLSNWTVLRLVACEDLYMEEQAPGICLPSRIPVNLACQDKKNRLTV